MSSSTGPDSPLWVTILAGGIGARFWPASTPTRPKPLLALGSTRPLIRDTVDRAVSLVEPDHLKILAGAHLVSPFRSLLSELGEDSFWIEPAARGTGPALVWAAHRVHAAAPNAVLVSLHADHRIAPESDFLAVVRRAVRAAVSEDVLLSIAVEPTRAETGYGYLRPGEPFAESEGPGAFRISEFVEKPPKSAAEQYISSGYLWNTGIFVLPVARFLSEVRRHAPELGACIPLLDEGDEVGFFEQVSSISVDEAVFERSDRVGAIRAGFQWDDVGSWEALARTLPGDPGGNCGVGQAHYVESHRSIVWAEDGPVVVFGLEDVVVVQSGGVTLVTPRDRARDLKQLLAALPRRLREGGPETAEATARNPEDDRSDGEEGS